MEKNNNPIIVPVDFSDHSRAALEIATTFALDSDAALLIIHVADDSVVREFSESGIEPDAAVASMYDVLHAVAPTDDSVPFTHRLLQGTPAKEILKLAEEENAAMIVMGTHGRRGLRRMVLGSVAEAVVRGAKCPVLTIRQPLPVAETANA